MYDRTTPPERGRHPETREETYCSRWCGGKCTKAAYDRAVAESDLLAKRLGPGWTAHVWENLGWHFQVVKGNLKVHPLRTGSATRGTYTITGYMVFFDIPGQQVLSGKHDTPEAAVAEAIARASDRAARLHRAIADVEGMTMAYDHREASSIASELVSIKARLGALGLFKTLHALDGATRAIGYEMAESFERSAKPRARRPLERLELYHADIGATARPRRRTDRQEQP